MVYEDFTSFTEVDNASNRITVVSSTEANGLLHRNDTTEVYLYDDYGASHFGDYEHLIDAKSDFATQWLINNFCGLSNHIGGSKSHSDNTEELIYCNFYWQATLGEKRINLSFYDDAGVGTSDYLTGAVPSTLYYFTVDRNGSTSTVSVYSDSDRTTEISGSPLSLSTCSTTFRYLYAMLGAYTASADRYGTVTVYNLDIDDFTTYSSSYLVDTVLQNNKDITYDIDIKLIGEYQKSMHMDSVLEQTDTNDFKIGAIVGAPSPPDTGDFRIHYGDFAENYYLDCNCSRWDQQNKTITIETWLTKSQLQTLRNNVVPGAVRMLYKVLDDPIYYDTTWEGNNTLKIVPSQSSLDIMKNTKLMIVKTIQDSPISGPSGYLSVKISGYISGAGVL